ncbi:SDR family oxidoreductase [Actinokineospora sp. 24-640]
MRSLRDRVVLVTGGSAGLGEATARLLSERGARVVICGRDQRRLDAALDRMPGVDGVRCDVTRATDRDGLVDAVLDRWGRLDALVNNAGHGQVGRLDDLDPAEIDDIVAVNFTAVAQLTRLALPHLRERGGDIVMISSLVGAVPIPPLSLYSATKAGVDGLVTALRRETPHGVRVHAICPGPMRTEWLVRAVQDRPTNAEAPHRLSAGFPPDRVADQVARCLTAHHSRTVSVPRWWAPARLATLPPISRALDLTLAPLAPWLVKFARRYGQSL